LSLQQGMDYCRVRVGLLMKPRRRIDDEAGHCGDADDYD